MLGKKFDLPAGDRAHISRALETRRVVTAGALPGARFARQYPAGWLGLRGSAAASSPPDFERTMRFETPT